MKYIAYFTVIIFTFGCCFLVDNLLKRHSAKKGRLCRVRPAKRSVLFGIIISFLALVFGLYFGDKHWLVLVGAVICLLFGIGMIAVYCFTGITYDEQGFTYRALGRKTKHFRYADITGERALLTRSGVNAVLLLGDDEVYLYESMEGVHAFLKAAYEGWLSARNLDGEAFPPPNPTYLVWFPEDLADGSASSETNAASTPDTES